MAKKAHLILLLSCCAGLLLGKLSGQQLMQYSLYMLNPYLYNPGYAGTVGTLVAHGAYRQQWVNLPGAPESQYVDAHLPLYVFRGGVGLRFARYRMGAHQTVQGQVHYAYHFELGRETLLSVGIGGGYLQYALDGTQLRAPEGNYEPGGTFSHNDPFLPESKVAVGVPFAEMGLLLRYRRAEIGLAALPTYAPMSSADPQGNFRIRRVPQYVGTGRYLIDLSERLTLVPSFLMKVEPAATQVEISSVFRWRANTFAGLSWRGVSASARDAVVIFGGLKLTDKISFAYSYDISISSLALVQRGTHELWVGYDLGKPIGAARTPPIIYNPRFW